MPINMTNRIALVANGTIDLECGTTTNTLSRQEQVEFSPIFYITGTQLLVKTDISASEIEDLKGKRVAALQGSSNEAAVRKLNEPRRRSASNWSMSRISPRARCWSRTAGWTRSSPTACQIKVYAATKASRKGRLRSSVGCSPTIPISAMMQRGDLEFRVAGARAFADTFRSGEAEKIYAKWFDPLGIKIEREL